MKSCRSYSQNISNTQGTTLEDSLVHQVLRHQLPPEHEACWNIRLKVNFNLCETQKLFYPFFLKNRDDSWSWRLENISLQAAETRRTAQCAQMTQILSVCPNATWQFRIRSQRHENSTSCSLYESSFYFWILVRQLTEKFSSTSTPSDSSAALSLLCRWEQHF